MAKNRFKKIKGTKDFLVLAVACAFLCLWSIRDAWFPTQKILKKHPLEFPVTAAVPGVVQTVPVQVGDEVKGQQPLLILGNQHYKEAVAAAEDAYRAAVETKDQDLIRTKLDDLVTAKENLQAATIRSSDFLLETTHGSDPLHGKVLRILVEPAAPVEAGQTVLVIQPADTFYIFNKTLAVLSFLVMIAALIFHRIAAS